MNSLFSEENSLISLYDENNWSLTNISNINMVKEYKNCHTELNPWSMRNTFKVFDSQSDRTLEKKRECIENVRKMKTSPINSPKKKTVFWTK